MRVGRSGSRTTRCRLSSRAAPAVSRNASRSDRDFLLSERKRAGLRQRSGTTRDQARRLLPRVARSSLRPRLLTLVPASSVATCGDSFLARVSRRALAAARNGCLTGPSCAVSACIDGCCSDAPYRRRRTRLVVAAARGAMCGLLARPSTLMISIAQASTRSRRSARPFCSASSALGTPFGR